MDTATQSERRADVVVIGGTPAGIAAAIAAARTGHSVLLLERTSHLGGLPANGLGATDIHTRGATGGLFLEFVRGVRRHYASAYGEGSVQLDRCSEGYRFEPSVAERVLSEMLERHPGITVLLHRQFDGAPENVSLVEGKLVGVVVTDRETKATERVHGGVFIDATYEGDLAAAAGVRYRLGREDAREFNEPMAGQIYKAWNGDIGDGSTGHGDNAIQAYNYRLALTRVRENRVPIPKPEDYRRDDYVSLIDDVRLNRHAGVPGSPRSEPEWNGLGRIVSIAELPNGKTDANNHHAVFLSTDLPEENWPWPTSSWEWRDRFAQRLRDYTLGLLWFCQNDPELPQDFRAACAEWGLPRDEYADNGNFPRQVYVREGRRIVGEYLFTAHDALPAIPGGRPPLHADSVTASHYALDSHATRKRETGRAHLEGFFADRRTAPYTVPYWVMLPREVDGLIVPVAVSATHVGFSTLRMEPCWMALGEAAGTAAGQSLTTAKRLRDVNIAALQYELVRRGAVLVYFRDVGPGHPEYEAVQMLALRGLLPAWEARPDDPVTQKDVEFWFEVLGHRLASKIDPIGKRRGEYLSILWEELRRSF